MESKTRNDDNPTTKPSTTEASGIPGASRSSEEADPTSRPTYFSKNKMKMRICDRISCPMWSGRHSRSYGCQRYAVATHCHLRKKLPSIERNEYALFSEGVNESVLADLKEANDAFFRKDEYYQNRLRRLQSETPELQE